MINRRREREEINELKGIGVVRWHRPIQLLLDRPSCYWISVSRCRWGYNRELALVQSFNPNILQSLQVRSSAKPEREIEFSLLISFRTERGSFWSGSSALYNCLDLGLEMNLPVCVWGKGAFGEREVGPGKRKEKVQAYPGAQKAHLFWILVKQSQERKAVRNGVCGTRTLHQLTEFLNKREVLG